MSDHTRQVDMDRNTRTVYKVLSETTDIPAVECMILAMFIATALATSTSTRELDGVLQ